MIIVKLIGGLGNQMFQYAYAKSLQKQGFEVKLDILPFKAYKVHGGYQLDKFRIDILTANRIELFKYSILKILSKASLIKNIVMEEKNLLFNKEFIHPSDNKYIIGYFQSEKYFESIRNSLQTNFTIKMSLSKYTKKIQEEICSCNNNVSLHIRRGDYIIDKSANKIHGTCSLNYYKSAMNILEKRFGNLKYFIFSDDIDWVKENLKIDNAFYIGSKETRIPHEDIYLMSLCQHNIIANSTFSWWGAWLNKYEKKIVIAPKRWFLDSNMQSQAKDIIPQDWITI